MSAGIVAPRSHLVRALEAHYPGRDHAVCGALLEFWNTENARFWVGTEFEYRIGDPLEFSVDFFGLPWLLRGRITRRTAEYVELRFHEGEAA